MSIDHEIDLQFGEGIHRLVICFHSRDWWVLQVPFLGKAWSYGQEGRGRMGWAALRRQKAPRPLAPTDKEGSALYAVQG